MGLQGKVQLLYGSFKLHDSFLLFNEVMDKTFDPSKAVTERIRLLTLNFSDEFVKLAAELLLFSYLFYAMVDI